MIPAGLLPGDQRFGSLGLELTGIFEKQTACISCGFLVNKQL
jgi:hypothetical protein